MNSSRIERIIRSVQRLRLIRSLISITLLLSAASLFYFSITRIEERYLLYFRIPALVVISGICLFAFIRIILKLQSETPLQIARELDLKYGLKERLSAYAELKDKNHPFLPALVSETEKHLHKISAASSADMTRGIILPLCIVGVFTLLYFTIPYWPVPPSIAAKAERSRRIQREAKELVKKMESLNKEMEVPKLQSLAEEIKKTAKEMEKPDVEPLEAMKDLNTLQEKLKKVEKEMNQDLRKSMLEKINTAGQRSESQKGAPGDQQSLDAEARELQKELAREGLEGGEQIEKALRNGTLTKEQIQKMKQSLKEYREQKEQQQQKTAEMMESLRKAQKGMRGGKGEVIYNSRLDDREVDKGKGGVEDGPGTTNKDTGPKKFDTKKKGQGQYKEDRTKAEYEKLYEGQREDVGKDPLFVGSEWDSEKSKYVKIRTFGENSEPVVISQPSEAAPQSQDESVITKEKIPAAYRDMIRKYFESIGQ